MTAFRTANDNGSALVVVDKPCLYFGFRPIGVDSIAALTVNSKSDRSMYIKCRIHPKDSPFKVGSVVRSSLLRLI